MAPSILFHLCLALLAVIAVGRALGVVCRRVGQPAVVGDVIAGILLGPSLLGAIWPDAYTFLLPTSLQPVLGAVAELGVVLYMFLVGLELDAKALEGQMSSTVTIAIGSTVVPFALGAVLAVYLYEGYAPAGVPLSSFALFVGIATAIVAFPVLAKILAEAGLTRTDIGIRAIGAAAVSDLVIWCGLAVVVGTIQAAGDRAVSVALGTAAFLAVLFGVVRPIVGRLVRALGAREPSPMVQGVAILGMLAASWAASQIGVHPVIAAFLVGAIIPHDSRLSAALMSRLTWPVSFVLLPAFFAFAGMKTEIGLVRGMEGWMLTLLIIAVATVGKIGGTYVSARFVGRSSREARILGVLMNTRGLMELVVLNMGLELGLITPALFAMMVVMALATTMMTNPLLRRALSSDASQG